MFAILPGEGIKLISNHSELPKEGFTTNKN